MLALIRPNYKTILALLDVVKVELADDTVRVLLLCWESMGCPPLDASVRIEGEDVSGPLTQEARNALAILKEHIRLNARGLA